eukprot:gene12582-13870_t
MVESSNGQRGDARRRIIAILRASIVQLICDWEQGCFWDENFTGAIDFRLDFLLNFVLRNEEELGVDGLRNLLMEAIALFGSEISVFGGRFAHANRISTGAKGRQRYDVSKEHLEAFIGIGFKAKLIATLLGTCTRAIERRLAEYGLTMRQKYSDVEDASLDSIVRDVLMRFSNTGYMRMTGLLRARGLMLQRERDENIGHSSQYQSFPDEEWDGPLEDTLQVPETTTPADVEFLNYIDPLRESQDHGVDIYLEVIQLASPLDKMQELSNNNKEGSASSSKKIGKKCLACQAENPIRIQKCKECGVEFLKRSSGKVQLKKKPNETLQKRIICKRVCERAKMLLRVLVRHKAQEWAFFPYHVNSWFWRFIGKDPGKRLCQAVFNLLMSEFKRTDEDIIDEAMSVDEYAGEGEMIEGKNAHKKMEVENNGVKKMEVESNGGKKMEVENNGVKKMEVENNGVKKMEVENNGVKKMEVENNGVKFAYLGITYIDNGQCLAVGVPFFERDVLHGNPIPPGHVCVQVLAVNGEVPAPVTFDDNIEENLKYNAFLDGKLTLKDI